MLGLRSNPISAILTLICSVLSLVTALAYRAWFVGSAEYNRVAFICMIAASAIGLLSLVGLGDIASSLQFLLLIAGCMFYIYAMYYYVSIVLVGIDLDSFSGAFITCSALIGSGTLLSALNVLVRK